MWRDGVGRAGAGDRRDLLIRACVGAAPHRPGECTNGADEQGEMQDRWPCDEGGGRGRDHKELVLAGCDST